MTDNTTNNKIDPRLEKLLKEELTNRAKKLEVMNQWQKMSEDKHVGKGNLKILYGAISGLAAMFVVGFFFMHNVVNVSSVPELGNPVIPSTSAPVYRGSIVDPAIDNALLVGDTLQAIKLIDSLRQECLDRQKQLDSISINLENIDEVEETRLLINEELIELSKLKSMLKK